MGTERPGQGGDNGRPDAEAAERERRGDLHVNGSRLVTDIDPDAGTLDQVVYVPRTYPFDEDGRRVEIGRTKTDSHDHVTFKVLGATGETQGRFAVLKDPAGRIDVEMLGVRPEDIGRLETALPDLTLRDVLD